MKLFPAAKPLHSFRLHVSELHELAVYEFGNPAGVPVVLLHGGPGSGFGGKTARFFDPTFFRIIGFDQRGCGQSTPAGEIRENTTQDLIADIEAIRHHLKIPKWAVAGGSWGSALALAYSIQHPRAVSALLVWSIFLGTRDEILRMLDPAGAAQFFPDGFEIFSRHFDGKTGWPLLLAANKKIFGRDRQAARAAAETFSLWEYQLMDLRAGLAPAASYDSFSNEKYSEVEISARLESQYFQNDCFLADSSILNNINKIKNIPIKILHGRFDVLCPPSVAFALAQGLPQAELEFVLAGHSKSHPEFKKALLRAGDWLKGILND